LSLLQYCRTDFRVQGLELACFGEIVKVGIINSDLGDPPVGDVFVQGG